MSADVLSLRALNRATLARQMLLERAEATPEQAISRLAGMQAQSAPAPFVGLWTRQREFAAGDLTAAIDKRRIVKATSLRGTLHLLTAEDYRRFRTTLQPALTAGWAAITKGRRDADFDLKPVLEAARAYISESPRTFAEISDMLSAYLSGTDVGAMRYGVRTHLPLVQVPTETRWSYPGNPRFALAKDWLGGQLSQAEEARELVMRYLAAFGPGSAVDMQTWSGLPGLKEVFEAMRDELVVRRDYKKRELFDLPDAPNPNESTPAPPRFLPEYDNLLLSHRDRTRVLAEEYRSRVYLPGLRVRATILVDGFVQGAWSVEKKGREATLTIEPFAPISGEDRGLLVEEGERLARFLEPDASSHGVEFIEGWRLCHRLSCVL
jgi:hypothetical protein